MPTRESTEKVYELYVYKRHTSHTTWRCSVKPYLCNLLHIDDILRVLCVGVYDFRTPGNLQHSNVTTAIRGEEFMKYFDPCPTSDLRRLYPNDAPPSHPPDSCRYMHCGVWSWFGCMAARQLGYWILIWDSILLPRHLHRMYCYGAKFLIKISCTANLPVAS